MRLVIAWNESDSCRTTSNERRGNAGVGSGDNSWGHDLIRCDRSRLARTSCLENSVSRGKH